MKKLSLLVGMLLCGTICFSAGWGSKLMKNISTVGSAIVGEGTTPQNASKEDVEKDIIKAYPSPNPISAKRESTTPEQQFQSYCASILNNKTVNTSFSFKDYINSLQNVAKQDGLVIKQEGLSNQSFNALAIKALEKDIRYFKEEIMPYEGFVGKTECFKNIKSLYMIMKNTREELCHFISNSEVKGKEKWCYQEQAALCSCFHTHTPKELKSIFVTINESFETKWSSDPDKRGPMLPSEDIKPDKKTIFDEVHKLFLK